MQRSLPLVLFLLASACASVPAPAPEPVHVVFVGTTDVHGWFNGHVESPEGGGEGVLWGGLPALASYVEALREEHGGRVVVLDSGDMFQGTLESNLFEGEAVVRGYNVIGYSAAALGNHEFDFGPVGPDSVVRSPGDDPLGALKRNVELAMFPILSANVVEKETGKIPAWTKPYRVVVAGGARIGIIGLSTPDTPAVTMPSNVTTLQFTDPVAATVAAAKELRALRVDAIVVTAHMGGRCPDMSDPRNTSSCENHHEVMQYFEKLPPGTIDAFFAGHTHSSIRHYIKGVPVMQGLAYSREFSTLDLWIDTKNDKVVKSDIRPNTMICLFVYSGTDQCDPRRAPAGAKLEPRVFAGETILPDLRIANVIEPYLKRVAAKREEKIGIRTAERFTRSFSQESPLGTLLADALREATGADIALMNSGGIREELPAAELQYQHMFAVSPFDNYPAYVFLTGKQIIGILNATTNGARGIMQTSGLRYTYDMAKDADKPMNERQRLVSVTLADGTPLDPEKLYSVVMPDFVAAGGDGTQDVMSTVPKDRVDIYYARPLREVFIESLSKRPQPLEPRVEGRITVLNAR
ncbi:MAG TPA: 5'-nucleotidase C-terminal domain-containing protein [Thermoanaerobaculia bacterium]|nr:5'-nucleotidase C-terminal domain-containing protein [Thermoanaerobaculia bacterium]